MIFNSLEEIKKEIDGYKELQYCSFIMPEYFKLRNYRYRWYKIFSEPKYYLVLNPLIYDL